MNAPQPSFAEMSVALKLAAENPSVLSFGIFLEAQAAAQSASALNILAKRIDLSPGVTAQILAGEYHHADVIAAAHAFFKAMIPHEAELRALIERKTAA